MKNFATWMINLQFILIVTFVTWYDLVLYGTFRSSFELHGSKFISYHTFIILQKRRKTLLHILVFKCHLICYIYYTTENVEKRRIIDPAQIFFKIKDNTIWWIICWNIWKICIYVCRAIMYSIMQIFYVSHTRKWHGHFIGPKWYPSTQYTTVTNIIRFQTQWCTNG